MRRAVAEELPILLDGPLLHLACQSSDEFPQVGRLVVPTAMERPREMVGDSECCLDAGEPTAVPEEKARVQPGPHRGTGAAPKGLIPQTSPQPRFHASMRLSAAASVLVPTSKPARTMRTDGLGTVRSTTLSTGDGSHDATPQAPHSPLALASSRAVHAAASRSLSCGTAFRSECSGLCRNTRSGSRPRFLAASSTAENSRVGSRECSAPSDPGK